MKHLGYRAAINALTGFVILAQLLAVVGSAGAASHREAPLIALDPAADITDVYFFRSWEAPFDKVVLIMNVIPGQEPSSGPNYFNFDDQVLYTFHLDTNTNGRAENVTYEIRFKTKIQGTVKALKLPVGYAGVPQITAPVRAQRGRHRHPSDLHGHGDPQRPAAGSGHAGDGRGALERGSADHAELRGPGGPGHLSPLERCARLRGAARRDLLHRPRRHLRYGQPASDPPILTPGEDANDAVNPFGVDHLLRLQREHDRARDPDPGAHAKPERRARALRLDEPPEERPPASTTARRSARATGCRSPGWRTRSSTS